MNVLVTTEHRFHRSSDGRVWTETQCPYSFWTRYLDVFDEVAVLARVRSCASPASGWIEASGRGVNFMDVPYYVGPREYLRRRRAIRHLVTETIAGAQAVLLRVPSQLAGVALTPLRAARRPYAVEVIGDPYAVFSSGSSRDPLRALWRWHFTRVQRKLCATACGAAYVTERALQLRYPCRSLEVGVSDVDLKGPQTQLNRGGHVTHYSSIDLDDSDFVAGPREFSRSLSSSVPRLIVVGSLAQPYKGVDVLLRAIAECRDRGRIMTATVVGDGRYRPELERLAERLRVADNVQFTGSLPAGEAVKRLLDVADVFVLPSRAEGLPRALIEAMARGLPCLASNVGGIPELLPADNLVTPDDAIGLADKLMALLGNAQRMAALGARNLEKAREFHDDVLRLKRREFYRHLQHQTQAVLRPRTGSGERPVMQVSS